MGLHRLQGLAVGRRGVAVVDEEACERARARDQLFRKGRAGGPDLADRTGRGAAKRRRNDARWNRVRRQAEGQLPSAIPMTRSRQPCAVITNCRTGRASRNSLAMTIAGPSGTSARSRCHVTGRCNACQNLPLACDECRGHLDEMDRDGFVEGRQDAGGAQEVGHQRAAAGAEFDEPHLRRMAVALPTRPPPRRDQFPEDLADLGRGGEVAAAPSGSRVT